MQGVTVLGINPSVLSRSSRLAKRGLDLAGAGLLSILALPLLHGAGGRDQARLAGSRCSSARSASVGAAPASGC